MFLLLTLLSPEEPITELDADEITYEHISDSIVVVLESFEKVREEQRESSQHAAQVQTRVSSFRISFFPWLLLR